MVQRALSWLYNRLLPGRATARKVSVDHDSVECEFRPERFRRFKIDEMRRVFLVVVPDSVDSFDDLRWRIHTTRGLFNLSHSFTRGVADFESLIRELPDFDDAAYQNALELYPGGEGTFECWRFSPSNHP